MNRLTVRPFAKSDIQEIVDYYDSINPILSDIFMNELDESILSILENPESYQKRLGDIRIVFLK